LTVIILCVDGFDPDYAQENGFTMPFERKLTIPKELYHLGAPHTMHVWHADPYSTMKILPNLVPPLRVHRKRLADRIDDLVGRSED